MLVSYQNTLDVCDDVKIMEKKKEYIYTYIYIYIYIYMYICIYSQYARIVSKHLGCMRCCMEKNKTKQKKKKKKKKKKRVLSYKKKTHAVQILARSKMECTINVVCIKGF